ncbi:MAG: GTPase Era [Tissierellia bacterium]|nr:GTPase Era [Tissierellia bacterium]
MKSGFVSVVGRANVGKSTLMQEVLKEKISIISSKAQTTRNKIQIIYNDDDSQIVFLDTPGIQQPKNKLQDYLLEISKESLEESDLIVFIVDHSQDIGRLDKYILDMLKKVDRKKILVINKIDLLTQDQVISLIAKFQKMNLFEDIIGISALRSINIDLFIETIKKNLNEGPMYYPDYMITDKSERFIVSEMIREKALKRLGQEIPHGIFIRMDGYKKRENKNLYDISATIIVERESHKQIVIGKKGFKIKQIGTDSRIDIEKFLDAKVNLKLWVSVEKNWRKNQDLVKKFGYR